MGYKSKRKKLYTMVFFCVVIVAVAITLFALFIMPKNKVITFENCNVDPINQEVEPIKLKQGTLIEELPEINVYGYVFEGWYYNEDLSENSKVKVGEDRLTKNVSLYPKIKFGVFTVTFDINGGTGNTPDPITLTYKSEFTFPSALLWGIDKTDPVYGEMVLRHWSTSPDGTGTTGKQNEKGTITGENVTYYAFWYRQTTVITYYPNGGQYVASKEYPSGVKLPQEAIAPATGKTGYVFDAWYYDEECTNGPANTNKTMETGELKLYAKWNPRQINVDFYLDVNDQKSGKIWKSQVCYFDGKVSQQETPTKEGSYFKYWAIGDSVAHVEFNFNSKLTDIKYLTQRMSIFGVWSAEVIIADETPKENFTYEVTSDNKIKITGLSEEGKKLASLKVPRQINLMNVISIDGIQGNNKLTTVGLPHTLETIGPDAFLTCTNITSFYFTSNNQNFTVVDGVIYDANKTVLYRYPAAKPETSYTTQYSTKTISGGAFNSAKFLKTVILNTETIQNSAFYYANSVETISIENNVATINDEAFRECDNIKVMIVKENNTKFKVENGILYGVKAGVKSKVIKCFNKAQDARIVVDNNVTDIAGYAFQKCSKIKYLEIGEKVSNFGRYCLYDITNLEEIKFKNNATTGIVFGVVWFGANHLVATINAYENSMMWLNLSGSYSGILSAI